MKFTLITRAKKDSIKAFYIDRSDREYGRAQVFAAGLTTGDSWVGVEGMLVIGGFRDCTGGRKATRAYHFPVLGMKTFGSWVRCPQWFWRPWYRLAQWLQYKVDTRYALR